MINVVIYLDKVESAQDFAESILKSGLAASASIDVDNSYYLHANGKVVKTSHTVITLQTKSLLFSQLEEYITNNYGPNIPIYSMPITHANKFFDQFIRDNTNKI